MFTSYVSFIAINVPSLSHTQTHKHTDLLVFLAGLQVHFYQGHHVAQHKCERGPRQCQLMMKGWSQGDRVVPEVQVALEDPGEHSDTYSIVLVDHLCRVCITDLPLPE